MAATDGGAVGAPLRLPQARPDGGEYQHRVLSRAYPLVYPLARYLQLSLPAELYADIEQEAGREELCAWVLGVQQQPQPPTETQRKRWTDRPPAATPITIHEVCTRLAYWHCMTS